MLFFHSAFPCCMPMLCCMSMLHAHVHAAWSFWFSMLNVNAACVAACISILHEHAAYHSANKASSTNRVEPRGETLLIGSANLINWLISPICHPKSEMLQMLQSQRVGEFQQQRAKYAACHLPHFANSHCQLLRPELTRNQLMQNTRWWRNNITK